MTTTINTDGIEELEEIIEDAPFDPQGKYSSLELEEEADKLLKADADRELCRKCKEKDPEGIMGLPYGEETGEIESVPQFDDQENPLVDEEGNQLYLDFPELRCKRGHRWYQGEGARRNINGPNPILFESHLTSRKRREIMVESGTPDSAFNKNRWGRPDHLMYNRSHPEGRKINSQEQRTKSGASYYR
jgi:hypothetical protein